jgi:hypothetical protein
MGAGITDVVGGPRDLLPPRSDEFQKLGYRSHILKYKMMLSNSPFFLGLPNNSYKSITNMALV